jgi:nicotinate-nucleotide adenylyltransferase
MRLGVFGGTFDPPHGGHLILAEAAREQLGLQKVLWVLTPTPPHKPNQPITALETRLAMVVAAIRGNPGFELSRVEIDRSGPHFAVDTMLNLAETNPQDELIYLMGEDSLRDLPGWREPQSFVAACHSIGVMRRPGAVVGISRLEALLPGIGRKIAYFDTPQIEISSSAIRQRAGCGKTIRYLMPEAVFEIIEQTGCYR